MADIVISIAPYSHSYRMVTKVGQTILEQAKTVLSTSRILLQVTKVRLRYKHVDFLGTANRTAVADMIIFVAPYPQLQEGYDDGTGDIRANKDCTIDELLGTN